MLIRDDRWDIGEAAVRAVIRTSANKIDVSAHEVISSYQHANREHEKYVAEHGTDPDNLATPAQFEA